MKKLVEINFDGLVGPTHHYGGLSHGNIASQAHEKNTSNPKEAALQGLKKMRLCLDLGLKQGLLLPHYRPAMFLLKELGFNGDEQKTLELVAQENQKLFSAIFSSSSMWTANAATIAPSLDTADQRCHITPANLAWNLHRAIEADFTHTQLKKAFDSDFMVVHTPLLFGTQFPDEGAANHTRLCTKGDEKGIHIFVFGEQGKTYPARQSLSASQAVVRRHKIEGDVVYLQQHPDAIDAGVFHNDVIAVGNEYVYVYHEHAYVDDSPLIALQEQIQLIKISAQEISLKEAVDTYLFNSQLVTKPDQTMALILPAEVEENGRAKAVVDRLLADENPIQQAYYIDCRQSMHNGGGPACLRLRVQLTEQELDSVNEAFLVDYKKITALEKWVEEHYRDSLTLDDFLDPQFRGNATNALDALATLLNLESLY